MAETTLALLRTESSLNSYLNSATLLAVRYPDDVEYAELKQDTLQNACQDEERTPTAPECPSQQFRPCCARRPRPSCWSRYA